MENSIAKPEPVLNSLLDVAKRFPNEQACREYLEKARWTDEIICPHCESTKVYRYQNGKLYKCGKCRKQFTVKVGTIFEDSPLPLQKWFFAIYILTSHRKGISSLQLSRDIQVTQKTAWFMLHRIRYAVKTKSFTKPLHGIVEADETYIGGRDWGGKRGRGSKTKIPIFGMVERNGLVIAQKVDDVAKKTLLPIMREHIARSATIMTDESLSYHRLNHYFRTHKKINHSQRQFVRGNIHTNNIENFWSLFKRGIFGIYHHVSKEQMPRYCDEFAFRYNSRHVTDTQRFYRLVHGSQGRLTYEELIDHRPTTWEKLHPSK